MVNNKLKYSGGGVLVQGGITSSAGIVKIKEVDMDKSIVLSVSKGSAGYVAARGDIAGKIDIDYGNGGAIKGGYTTLSMNAALSGGSTDLTVKEYSARLISPTDLECDGPVEWQVIEFK